MAVPLTSELRESDPEPVALVREAEDSAVVGDMIAAARGRKAKRDEYRCAGCGYGIVVYGQAPNCPMCSEARWEHVEWRPFSQLLDFPFAELARWVGPRVSRPGYRPGQPHAPSAQLRRAAEATAIQAWEDEGGTVALTTSSRRGWATGGHAQTAGRS